MDDCLANYYICFIDLMGQKDFFREINSDSLNAETLNHVNRVSDGLKQIVQYIKNRYDRNFVRDDDAGIELFSDSILLSMRANNKGCEKLIQWLNIICKVVYIACNYHLPFRGSIVRGHAARSESGTIYGSAVDEAIRIEAVYTDYPRIVIQRALIDEFMREESLKKYFSVDADSALVLNYAGEELIASPEFVKEKAALGKIHEWVLSCYRHFCYTDDAEHNKAANPKLARRYVMWLEYLKIEAYRGNRHV